MHAFALLFTLLFVCSVVLAAVFQVVEAQQQQQQQVQQQQAHTYASSEHLLGICCALSVLSAIHEVSRWLVCFLAFVLWSCFVYIFGVLTD
jgi:uncharacterized metal-binding protein